MSRITFSPKTQKRFISKIKEVSQLTWDELGGKVGVSGRTLRDWKNSVYSIDLEIAKKLCEHFNIPLPKNGDIESVSKIKSRAGKHGGEAIIKKYGKVPVEETRRKEAWEKWWKSTGKEQSDLTRRLKINKPRKGAELAEFIGIMIGDGGITERQITVSLHKSDDREYAQFVKSLIQNLFHCPTPTYERKRKSAIQITVSRTELVEFCIDIGLVKGDKIDQGVDIPAWIKDTSYIKPCVRGLVDTDGCIFWEKHTVKNTIYSYPRLNFTTASPQLRDSVVEALRNLGYSPRIRRRGRSVQLEDRQEICDYFEHVGTNNPKHERRFLEN